MVQTGAPAVVRSMSGEVLAALQSIYEVSTIQRHSFGAKLRLGDRIFRYGANSTSADLSPGYMTTGPTVTAAHANISVTTSAVVGQSYVDVTLGASAVTQNQYADGYLWFNAGGTTIGEGCAYKIRNHLANAGSATLRLWLYDPLATALTATTTKATLYANPWSSMVIHPATTPVNRPTGVPLVKVAQSTAAITYYAWFQTGGFCPMYVGATYTIGTAIGVDDTAGSGLTSTAEQWGIVTQVGSAADQASLIWLTLDQ